MSDRLTTGLTEVFDDCFDIEACIALRELTRNISSGKKRLVKQLLADFGYTAEVRVVYRKQLSPLVGVSYAYFDKESPWQDVPLPARTSIVHLKSSLMAVSSTCGDFLEKISADPQRIAWQWVEYWKVLSYLYPNEGYRNY